MNHLEAPISNASQSSELRFIRLKEVLAICGKSRSSIYEAIKKGEFPRAYQAAWSLLRLDQERSFRATLTWRSRGLDATASSLPPSLIISCTSDLNSRKIQVMAMSHTPMVCLWQ